MIARAIRPALLLFVVALFDCAALERIEPDTCGNGSIEEATEECDTHPALPTTGTPRQCGAAGVAGQCRLLCNRKVTLEDKSEIALDCPPGWGCGVDSICRRPIGEKKKAENRFYEPTDGVSAGVTSLLVGDFDGDRRKDIFGSSALGVTPGKGRIHYFGQGAILAGQPAPLSAVITSPFVRDFDGDGRDDLAFGYNYRFVTQVAGGLALLLGQSDRAIVPKLFPSFIRPFFQGKLVPVAGNDPGNPSGFLAVGKGSLDGKLQTNGVVAVGESGVAYIRPFTGTNPSLVGTPVAGFILPAANLSYCGEVVIGYRTDEGPRVDVHSPCAPTPPADKSKTQWVIGPREPKTIDLRFVPKSAQLVGVHVADVDGDGDQDILVGTRVGPNQEVYVAINRGDDFGIATKAKDYDDLPLASGDINQDGFTDFVLPGAVLMSQRKCQTPINGGSACADPPPDAGAGDAGGGDGGADEDLKGYYSIKLPSKEWTVAAVADVNGDGVLDVIGASSLQPDIDVMQGNTLFVPGTSEPLKGVFMPSFTVTTNGVVTQLVIEDLDVDGVRDIAFVQQRTVSDDPNTVIEGELAIAYGKPLTMPPEPARPSGRADGITQLFSQIAGIAICTTTPVKDSLPTFSLAILFGSGERQPFAPLLFDDGPGNTLARVPPVERSWAPRNIGAGAVETKGRIDFIALAEGTRIPKGIGDRVPKADAYGVWVAKLLSPAIYDSPVEKERLLLLEAAAAAGGQLLLQSRVADVDNDGLDEIVAVTPASATSAAIRVLRVGKPEVTVEIPDRTITEDARGDVVDVDGDGFRDVVAMLRDKSGNLVVTVYFNDGKGGFILPGVPVALPDASAPRNKKAQGFAFLTTQAADLTGTKSDVVRQIAIVTPGKLFLVRPKGRTFEPAEDLTGAFGVTGVSYGTDVASGDFDGDGVEDIAIADSGQIRILRQRPRLE